MPHAETVRESAWLENLTSEIRASKILVYRRSLGRFMEVWVLDQTR